MNDFQQHAAICKNLTPQGKVNEASTPQGKVNGYMLYGSIDITFFKSKTVLDCEKSG